MKIDNKTMLFLNLTNEEATDLQRVCEYLVLDGVIDGNTRHWFELWRKGCGLDERQMMISMSSAFPQRALLSLLLHSQKRPT